MSTREAMSALSAMTVLVAAAMAQAPARAPVKPFESAPPGPAQGQIDKLVFARLDELGIEPARLCSDAVFLRRAHLDVLGTLPTAEEARRFLADKSPHKRRTLIDELLNRPEFADYWAMKWCDLLRVKAEFPVTLWPKAAQAYHRWIRACLRENRPYDRMARELLLATGSNFYAPPANFYRAVQNRQPAGLAQAAALTFMGMRVELWPEQRRKDLAVFFWQVRYKSTAEWKEEIVYLDVLGEVPLPASARLPDGSSVALPAGGDARAVFADWLVAANNPYFAPAAVNRIWFWLLGRGIVHEADDFRADNPPANAALLEYLAAELVASGYDLKHIYRLILNSQTYQLSSIPASTDERAPAQFAHYPLRRLEAEVLIDALCRISGTREWYTSAVPEPFTYIPQDVRSIAISDGNTSSAFLELFGRPSRDTGLLSERTDRTNAAQRLHMLNSSHVQNKIVNGPKLRPLLQAGDAPAGGGNRSAAAAQPGNVPKTAVETLYLTILSRHPSEGELQILADYGSRHKLKSADVLADLAWALINSEEFLHRH